MLRFLPNFELDRLSFWLGFFAGALVWWILGVLRPWFAQLRQRLKQRLQQAREQLLTSTEVRHANDTLRQAQRLHLAAPLFSLDEIIIPPRLLAPPAPVEPLSSGASDSKAGPADEDIVEQTLPYLPDWPELGAIYNAPTLSLLEALQEGANLAIIGRPGSGKSIALAYLATQLVRRDPNCGELAGRVPLLIHAADLSLASHTPEDTLTALVNALASHASVLTLPRLPAFVKTICEAGRALLLLDGLDEIAPSGREEVVHYLHSLLALYPQTRLVAACAERFDGLTGLGCAPLAIAHWNEAQRAAYISQWNSLWTRYVAPAVSQDDEQTDPLLLVNWLLNDPTPLTPLELSLKAWGAYAGDLPGPSACDALNAYLERMAASLTGALPALQTLAVQSVFSLQTAFSSKAAENWLAQIDQPPPVSDPSTTAEQAQEPEHRIQAPEQTSLTGVLPGLIENGLLVPRAGGRFTLVHPVIAGYLAGGGLSAQDVENLLSQPEWEARDLALEYLAARGAAAQWMRDFATGDTVDPLMNGLFKAARWLRQAPMNTAWQPVVMRLLAACLQNDLLPLSLRARALAALAVSNKAGVDELFRQLLACSSPYVRQLAALGCGVLHDPKAVSDLTLLLADRSPVVRRSACLAMTAIGDKPALEAVATALLHGDEDLRQAAAEALANHTEEGQPTLEEGSKLDELLVRRAVVFGLARIARTWPERAWAKEVLEKMQFSDAEWVVKNAAAQALEELNRPNQRIPRPLLPLSDTPWLIAFAAEKGLGIAPGKPAEDLVILAFHEGREEQRLAALNYLARSGLENALPSLYQSYQASTGELREAIFNTLWHMAHAGIHLRPIANPGFSN